MKKLTFYLRETASGCFIAKVAVPGGFISEVGDDADAAVGKLIRHHGETFGISVRWEEKLPKGRVAK